MISCGYADRLRALPLVERQAFRDAHPELLAAVRYDLRFWARDVQLELLLATSLATIELITGGRRAGKTWLAVALFLREILAGRARWLYPRIVAATDADALGTIIDGPSGIRTWCPPEHRPRFFKSGGHGGLLVFESLGTEVNCLSVERPSQAIGEGSGLTLFDDPAKAVRQCGEHRAREMLKQIRISNSEGASPCVIMPTTPVGDGFIRAALTPGEMDGVRRTFVGDLDSNTSLSPKYKASLRDLRDEDPSEFDGILRGETPGALWKRVWIDHVDELPELRMVVVAIDPADDGKQDSDETGIVVVGLGEDERLYVLADYTARWRAEQWAAVASWALRKHGANALVAEGNRAWSAVEHALNVAAPGVRVVRVDAGKGKAERAQPVAIQYSEGLVSHLRGGPQLGRAGVHTIRVPMFDPGTGGRPLVDLEVKRDRRGWETLEDELCGWDPRKRRSPNGLDALVWGAWHLRPPAALAEPWEPAAGTAALAGVYGSADPRRGSTDPRQRVSRWQAQRGR